MHFSVTSKMSTTFLGTLLQKLKLVISNSIASGQTKIIFVLPSLNVDLHTMKKPKLIALYVLCRNREVAQNSDIFKTILNTRYLFVY